MQEPYHGTRVLAAYMGST